MVSMLFLLWICCGPGLLRIPFSANRLDTGATLLSVRLCKLGCSLRQLCVNTLFFLSHASKDDHVQKMPSLCKHRLIQLNRFSHLVSRESNNQHDGAVLCRVSFPSGCFHSDFSLIISFFLSKTFSRLRNNQKALCQTISVLSHSPHTLAACLCPSILSCQK